MPTDYDCLLEAKRSAWMNSENYLREQENEHLGWRYWFLAMLVPRAKDVIGYFGIKTCQVSQKS